MPNKEISLPDNYWNDYQILPADLEYLYNHLLELETPLSSSDLLIALLNHRITQEKENLTATHQNQSGVYKPKDEHHVSQELIFPHFESSKGKVANIRNAINPEHPNMKVIEVIFENSVTKYFASQLQDHALNEPARINENDSNFNLASILQLYGKGLTGKINQTLSENKDLVLIAGKWFPRSLLVDVNQGHLNLAEAILEEANGGPLPISKIIEQADLPKDVNPMLLEFSLDLALQEDSRFDEVGPSGETLWFLKAREPELVKKIPNQLHYFQQNTETLPETFHQNAASLLATDELESQKENEQIIQETGLALLFPHWRTGTIPLTQTVRNLLPTAHEAPRIRFQFIDSDTQKRFEGWVVRPHNYVLGLSEWYKAHDLIPGSIIRLNRTSTPGEIQISFEKRKQNREWIRTALIGSDGGVVFAMIKQPISAAFEERMAIYIPDLLQIDAIWDKGVFSKLSINDLCFKLMKELAKLNPQGQVHAQELYATINLLRRCPPTPILKALLENGWATHLGDLYFKINDAE